MLEKIKWTLNAEKIRHKYNRGYLMLELTGAVVAMLSGSMMWATLMVMPVFAILIREKAHADFLLPRSDEEIKNEALAMGTLISVRYTLCGLLAVIITLIARINKVPMFENGLFGTMLMEHRVYTLLFMFLVFTNCITMCLGMCLKREDVKKKAFFEKPFWSVFEFMAAAVLFTGGMDIQGLHFVWVFGSYEGLTARLAVIIAALILIIHTIVIIKEFSPGDFFGTTAEMIAENERKKTSKR